MQSTTGLSYSWGCCCAVFTVTESEQLFQTNPGAVRFAKCVQCGVSRCCNLVNYLIVFYKESSLLSLVLLIFKLSIPKVKKQLGSTSSFYLAPSTRCVLAAQVLCQGVLGCELLPTFFLNTWSRVMFLHCSKGHKGRELSFCNAAT